jgi:hypothetical protein
MRPLWGLDVGRARACPEVYVPREDAERFIEEVRGDEPELARHLRIEKRELPVGDEAAFDV